MIYLLVNYQVNTLFEKLKSLGYDIEPQNQAELFKQFKAIADKKKSVTDAIILNMSKMQFIKLIHFNCSLFQWFTKCCCRYKDKNGNKIQVRNWVIVAAVDAHF